MTLNQALAITGIREEELNRINLKALDYVIEDSKAVYEKTHLNHSLKYIEGLETIKAFLQNDAK